MLLLVSKEKFETKELALAKSQEYLLQLFPATDLQYTTHLFGILLYEGFYRLQIDEHEEILETEIIHYENNEF